MLAMLTLFLGNLGAGEIILIFSVILIFFVQNESLNSHVV